MNIGKARKAQKLTQAELAQIVGVSQRAIASYELKERRPSIDVAKRIGEALGIHWPQIFDEEAESEEKE